MPSKFYTRADDERDLRVLKRLTDGVKSPENAAADGRTRSALMGLVKRIKDDDLFESVRPAEPGELGADPNARPESLGMIRAAYQPRHKVTGDRFSDHLEAWSGARPIAISQH